MSRETLVNISASITARLHNLAKQNNWFYNHLLLRYANERFLYRRDQIYFTEKDNNEQSHLYSLIEFKEQDTGKKIRNDASFEKDYLNGLYGAIPSIGKLLDLR